MTIEVVRVGVDDAPRLVRDGATVACAGFVGAGHAEAVTAAIEHRNRNLGAPPTGAQHTQDGGSI